jgi:hypothetical protein
VTAQTARARLKRLLHSSAIHKHIHDAKLCNTVGVACKARASSDDYPCSWREASVRYFDRRDYHMAMARSLAGHRPRISF